MIKNVSFILFIFSLTVNLSFAGNVQQCGIDSQPSGAVLKIIGSNINVRLGPGTKYEKIINKKASEILKKTHYVTIDNSVTVIEECRKAGWSKIRVIEPDYLSKSHCGWVPSKFLTTPQNIQKNGNWYSDWHSDFHLGITKTLIAKNIRGCGEYKYRENMTDKNDFIVNCTSDGNKWVLYRVSTLTNTVSKIRP